jgi:hypothetical protein
MNPWQWFSDYETEALARDDGPRARLGAIIREAYALKEEDPDRALTLFVSGSRLAETLREPWWKLFLDHWQVTAMIYYLRDFTHVLDLAVRNTLTVQKPEYSAFPFRTHVVADLITAYLGIDPFGYAGEVREVLDYLEAEWRSEDGTQSLYRILTTRYKYALALERLEEARYVCLEMLSALDGDSDAVTTGHYRPYVYGWLCTIASRRGEFSALEECATAGLECVGSHQQSVRCQFLAHQTQLARLAGNVKEARRLLREATSRMARLRQPPTDTYFDALCAYHEAGDEFAQALRLRDRELGFLLGKGRLMDEYLCRVKRYRLFVQLGMPPEGELAEARSAAARLRRPERFLADLDRLATEGPRPSA